VHKNHKWALESFKEYQSNGGSAHLVLTGLESDSRWPDYSADQIFSNMSLKNVHRLGLVDRSFQLQLYAMAIAVIQPSRYEGWSTTIEEALSFGTPIIASDIPANREQLLDCTDAKFVSSDSELSLVEALHSPPDKQSKLQSESRNSFRWNRFLADLETILIRGDDLTRVD
jgi:glycosyltransferase involved in cell wall biosynthesis